jgi:Protein of unknown function (DUF3999)
MIGAVLLAAATVAGAWSNARTIVLPAIPQPAYVLVVLPQDIDGGDTGTYPDVRVAGDDNREVPYALDADPTAAQSDAATLSDVGFVPGQYTQAIADLGTSGALHSAIALQSSQPTFFEHVQIATSDDRQTWSIVKPDALIYRVAQNGDAGESTIDIGPTRARWLRIRILDGAHAFPITGASVAAQAPSPRLYALAAVTKIANTGTHTVATLDFGTANTNLAAVAFETRTPQFSRPVSYLISDGAKGDGDTNWKDVTQAPIARFKAGRPAMTADLGNQHTQLLKIVVDNGNDTPLADLQVTALGYQHHIIFLAQPGVTYRLLWHSDQSAPAYDLADRLAHGPWTVGAVATLGAAASTAIVASAAPISTTPWLQQAALPIALVIGFLVLAAMALYAMRKTNPPA